MRTSKLLMVVGFLLSAHCVFAHDDCRRDDDETLLVWAGDEAHEAPDFLAVIDFDRDSRSYGKVIRTVPLPAAVLGKGAVGNEPHHAGLSQDGRTLALGGLLSFLRSQPQVFFFDVSRPRHPRFIGANLPSGS